MRYISFRETTDHNIVYLRGAEQYNIVVYCVHAAQLRCTAIHCTLGTLNTGKSQVI